MLGSITATVAAVLAIALAGCTAGAAQSGSAATLPVAPLERIAMTSRSFWHSATTSSPFHSEWQIDADGEGSFRSIEARRDGANVLRQDDVTRRISVGPRGFRRIEALLRPAEAFAGGEVPCETVPYSDSTVGTLSWTRGGRTFELEFDQGCVDAFASRIFRRLDRAEALLTAWAGRGEIIRTAPHGRSRAPR